LIITGQVSHVTWDGEASIAITSSLIAVGAVTGEGPVTHEGSASIVISSALTAIGANIHAILEGVANISVTSTLISNGSVLHVVHDGVAVITVTSALTTAGQIVHAVHEGSAVISVTSSFIIVGAVTHAVWEGAGNILVTSEIIVVGNSTGAGTVVFRHYDLLWRYDMIQARQINTANYPILFFMVDSADHLTGKVGLTPTVTLSKNGGAFAGAVGAVSEISNGWYSLEGNATDRNTLGTLAIHATAVGADAVDISFPIVDYDPFAFVDELTPEGFGAVTWDYTLNDNLGNPIPGAEIWATSDIAGAHKIAYGVTDAAGKVIFMLDPGTYYIWGQKAGYVFSNPDTEVVV
jgi:hypothetical protein